MTVVSPGQLLCLEHVAYGNQTSLLTSLQGYTPEKLPPSSCVMAPELSPPNPAKTLFAKVTKTLFGKKKAKGEFVPCQGASGCWVTLSSGRSGSCLLERDLLMGLSGPLAWGRHKLGVPLLFLCWWPGMGVCLESGCCAAARGEVPPGSLVLHENWEVKVGGSCLTPSLPPWAWE